jgi:hypothetical protein
MQRKTAVLTVRVTPEFKSALKAAAERERRSQANLLECLVLAYCADSEAKRAVRPRPAAGRHGKARST